METELTREAAEELIHKHEDLYLRLRESMAQLQGYVDSVSEPIRACVDGEFADFVNSCGIEVLSRNLVDEVMQRVSRMSNIRELAEMDAVTYKRMMGDFSSFTIDPKAEASSVLKRAYNSYEVTLDQRHRNARTDEMMVHVLRMRVASRQIEASKGLLSFYANIDRAIRDLDRGTKRLKWKYATPEQRKAIRGAYDYLLRSYDSGYGNRARGVIHAASITGGLGSDSAWNDFTKNPGETFKILDMYAPGKFVGGSRKSSIPPCPYSKQKVDAVLVDYESAMTELRSAVTLSDSNLLRERVRYRAYALVKREVTEHLRSIPVEELNRGGKGYHVSTLRRAGYDNLAAVSAATIHNLRALRGISANSARMIKRDCETYASQVEPSIRIRLSSDNKNSDATDLVAKLYILITVADKRDKCIRYLHEGEGAYARAASTLKGGGYDALSWLVWEDLRKGKCQAYEMMRSGSYEEFNTWHHDGVESLKNALIPDCARAWKAFDESPFEFYNLLEDIVPELIGGEGTYGLPEELAREVEDQDFFPDGLLCTLRRYQEWGVKYALHQERVLLGDEMGLGKTVQAIATMVSLRNTGETHFMVVCPASVLVNWCREIVDKSKLRVTRVHGRDVTSALRSWSRSGGVAVTTYETLARFKLPEGLPLGMIVVDEAHYVKNPNARRSQNVRSLTNATERALFMTGTALENRVGEMIELIRVLQPDVAKRAVSMASLSSAPMFRDIVAPVYYRRRREDVLAEMPDLIESKVWCALEGEEVDAYEREVLSRNFMGSRRVSWNVDDIASSSSKAERMLEIIDDAEEDDRKVLVFSYFRDTIEKICDMLGSRAVPPINGSVAPQRRQEIIDGFEKAPAGTVLVAQIQSGGTGLNIQSASVVIICEPQLKPSIENQAISRAYRMGQTRNVLVYRLLCEDTVDERVTRTLEQKQKAFDAFADKSVAARESITVDDATQKDIIEREIERIMAKNDMENG